jgi:hypothetical protein
MIYQDEGPADCGQAAETRPGCWPVRCRYDDTRSKLQAVHDDGDLKLMQNAQVSRAASAEPPLSCSTAMETLRLQGSPAVANMMWFCEAGYAET